MITYLPLALRRLLAVALLLLPALVRAQVLPGTFATGRDHSLSIHADGTLWATGSNSAGQLGTGTTDASTAWVPVGSATNWVMVAAGVSYSLGLRADGTLWAWGINDSGQLGIAANSGTTAANPTPTQVPGTYTQLAAGRYHALALRADGTLWAWGWNSSGQLGNATNNGSNAANPTPTQVPGTGYTRVAAGTSHSLALRSDGTLWAWGSNRFGQLGNTLNVSTSKANPTPAQVAGTYTELAAGSNHSLALRADGSLWAWGYNEFGQLGTATNSGTIAATPTPTQVPGTYTRVGAGESHTLAVQADGTLWAWGSNKYGQLGGLPNSGVATANPTPAQVPGTYAQVAAGGATSLGLRADGTLYAWGANEQGQLGTATNSNPAAPTTTPTATGTALPTRSITMGGSFGLAVRADGTLWGWGSNASGQLGQSPGALAQSLSPVQIGTDNDWVMVAAGTSFALGLKADGTLYAWGQNRYGQLGNSTNNGTTAANPTPALVGSGYKSIAAGFMHSLGVQADGSLLAWGYNFYGQIANPTPANQGNTPNPTPRVVGAGYVAAAGGTFFSLALLADGTATAWGANDRGQLGNSTNAGSGAINATPLAVTGGPYVALAVGGTHSLGLQADGTLSAWGNNASGQLGSPANGAVNVTPTVVAGQYAGIAAGNQHSLGRRADGTLFTWGANTGSQLARPNTSTAGPTQEATAGTGWVTLATSSAASSTLVRTASGLVFASAGQNDSGQLGDGTTTNAPRLDRSSPLRSLQPLPVQLTVFTAALAGPTAVALVWATASESNSARFEVQRSPDGAAWATIGTVAAAGSSASARGYALTDTRLPAGASQLYYRLRQVDQDGKAAYSAVRTVALTGASAGLSLYPNPAVGGAATLTGATPGTVVQVLDALGRPVATAKADAAGAAALALPAGLAAGVYVVRAGQRAVRLTVE
jgi:alpha-tubulin suppressor-like RCC1 family protein